MPEVIFTGAAGRIEGRYHPARQNNAPIGIVGLWRRVAECHQPAGFAGKLAGKPKTQVEGVMGRFRFPSVDT